MRQIIISCLAVLFAFSSCNHARKQLVGKWKVEGGANENTWEFFENGTLSAGGAEGRYTFGDNKRLKIQTSAATFVYQFEIKGDRMSWKEPNGSKTELVRIK